MTKPRGTKPRRIFTPAEADAIVHLYANGSSLRTIAVGFGTTTVRVREVLVREGVTIRPSRWGESFRV